MVGMGSLVTAGTTKGRIVTESRTHYGIQEHPTTDVVFVLKDDVQEVAS